MNWAVGVAGLQASAGCGPAELDGFRVAYVGSDGVERRGPLRVLVDAAFEDGLPVRSFPSYKGQRSFPGLWWSATSGCHVGFESWLERDEAMLLDFDPQVVGFASQPLWLLWHETGSRCGRMRRTGSPGLPTGPAW